ncbi:MAG TPA: NAD-dependent dehydratase [Verrucomicrobia bacterium]|nr:MAG: NAD-dependent dehydratase [Lentisphaerae bacterium GWF2_57_35]HBA84124.1 NAD-dependent dehydratase [Verrucomicrobiota bacterium]
MNWNGKKAVVTGACGFIGSHLAEALVRRGAHATALVFYNAAGSNGWMDAVPPDVRKDIELVAGDIRDADFMRRLIGPGDTVFHLAALIGIPYSYTSPRSYVDTNITGTLNILEAARQAGARVINTSTSEVYGTALHVPIDEAHPLQAQSPYSATKIAAEKLAESYFKSFELPVTTVRPFNTFGPRQSPRAVIPTILLQLIAGQDEISLGDPGTTRDFNFVADTVEGLIRVAECDRTVGVTVNIGTGSDISVEQVVALAGKLLGRQPTIRMDARRLRPAASEVRRLQAGNELLKSLIGWTPPARVEEGLRITADWLQKEAGRYDSARYYI